VSPVKYQTLLSSYSISLGFTGRPHSIRCKTQIELGQYRPNNLRSENGLFFMSWFTQIPRLVVKKHGRRGVYTTYLNTMTFIKGWIVMYKFYYVTFLLFKNASLRGISWRGLANRFYERVNFEFDNDLEFRAFSTYRMVIKDVSLPLLVNWQLFDAKSSGSVLERNLSEFYFRSFQVPMAYFKDVRDKNIWFY
jgi:hypothetical protein